LIGYAVTVVEIRNWWTYQTEGFPSSKGVKGMVWGIVRSQDIGRRREMIGGEEWGVVEDREVKREFWRNKPNVSSMTPTSEKDEMPAIPDFGGIVGGPTVSVGLRDDGKVWTDWMGIRGREREVRARSEAMS